MGKLIITKSSNATAVLSNGELQWDYANLKLRVHDGYTAGGRVAITMYPSGFSYNLDIKSYILLANESNADEGDVITFSLETRHVPDGETIDYSISGVDSSDVVGGQLSGTVTVLNNSATISITLAADATTEGTETLSVSAAGRSQSTSIIDTSLTPSYSLSSSSSTVDEGDSFTITLVTENVEDGTTLDYTITGVSSEDIDGASLTGTFTVTSGTATLSVSTTADVSTEGEETFNLALDNGGDTVDVLFTDTSIEPTYTLSRSATAVNEGGSFTITLSTTGVENGVTVPYTITGVSSADISGRSLTGSFTVNSGTASSGTITVAADATTEGTETFLLSLNNGEDSISVTFNDTSLTPSFSMSFGDSTPNEGTQLTIYATATNYTSTLYWSTNATTADVNLTSGAMSYSSQSGNQRYWTAGTVILADSATEGNETFTVYIRTGSTSGTIVAQQTFQIQDTSQAPADFFASSWTNSNLGFPRYMGADWSVSSGGGFYWIENTATTYTYNGQTVYPMYRYTHSGTGSPSQDGSGYRPFNTTVLNGTPNGMISAVNNYMYTNGGWGAYWPQTIYGGNSSISNSTQGGLAETASGWGYVRPTQSFSGSPDTGTDGGALNHAVSPIGTSATSNMAVHRIRVSGGNLSFQTFNINTNAYTSFTKYYYGETGRTIFSDSSSIVSCYDPYSDWWFLTLNGYNASFGWNIEVWSQTDGYIDRFTSPGGGCRWLTASQNFMYWCSNAVFYYKER
jgi:hypothetical protein